MGIVCNLTSTTNIVYNLPSTKELILISIRLFASTINVPTDSFQALLIFEECSKNSPIMDVLREHNF